MVQTSCNDCSSSDNDSTGDNPCAPRNLINMMFPCMRITLHKLRLGLLEHVDDTKWGFPGFISPKKDGTIPTIEDFHKLNK